MSASVTIGAVRRKQTAGTLSHAGAGFERLFSFSLPKGERLKQKTGKQR